MSGAFRHVDVRTSVATGSLVVKSVTPTELVVDLGGITTLLADVPEGVSVHSNGRAFRHCHLPIQIATRAGFA